jgi:threonine/homoserine/homoserine lactone efflux protein
VVCGQGEWALTASAGIAALLVASGPSFIAVKLAAAAYVYLGCQALLAAARRQDHLNPGRPTAGGRELREGLLSNLGISWHRWRPLRSSRVLNVSPF